MRQRWLLAGFVLGWITAPLGAGEYEVGLRGARVRIADDWKPIPVETENEWRFQRAEDVAVVVERELLLDTSEDVTVLLDEWAAAVAKLTAEPAPLDVSVSESDGVLRGTKRMDATDGGTRFTYVFSASSRSGLTLLISIFTPKRYAKRLAAAYDDFTSDLAFPGPDTDWGRSAVPVRRVVDIAGDQVSFELETSVWTDVEIEGAWLSLASTERHLALHMFTSKNPPAEDIEATLEVLRAEFPTITEVERKVVPVAGIESHLLRAEVRGADGVETTFRLFSIPLSGDTTLDLRLVNYGGWDSRARFFEQLLASFEISRAGDLDAFPVPAPIATRESPTPEVQALLGSCRFVGVIPGVVAVGGFRLDDGRIAAYGRGRIGALDAAGGSTLMFDSDWDIGRREILRGGNSLYYRGRGGRLAVLEGDSFRWPDFIAMSVAAVGEEQLLVGRREPPQSDDVFQGAPARGPDRLLMRAADGVEEEIWSTSTHVIDGIEPSSGGTDLLLTQRPIRVNETYEWYEPHELVVFDRAARTTRSLGEWRLDHVGPADEGWVVTGAPAGGATGIYVLLRDGSARLLISGPAFFGVEIREGALLFGGTDRLATDGASGGTAFYEGPLPVLLERGPAVMPFAPEALNDVAAAALQAIGKGPDDLFRDGATVAAFVAAAQTASRERLGLPLPEDMSSVDRLLTESIRFASFFDAGGVSLCAALLASAMIREGAEWVDARPSCRFAWRAIHVSDHCFAYALSPVAMVSSTLFDEKGYWRPIQEAGSAAEGRRILLGVDPQTLAQRLRELDEPQLLSWIDAGATSELLTAFERAPANHYLRYEVYEHLHARGRFEELRALAVFRSRPEAVFIDELAALGAQVALLDGPPPTALVEELRQAIARYPRAPRLYLLLGKVYQRLAAQDPLALRRARACFAKALELDPEGDVGQRAQHSINDLGEG